MLCSSPQPYWRQGLVAWKTTFPWTGVEDGFRMIQEHYIYCAFYFCYFYISSTSHHQSLDTGGWGLQLYRTKERNEDGCDCSLAANASNLVAVHICSLSCVQLFVIPWTVTRQSPLSNFQARILQWIAISYSSGYS